MSRRSAPFTNWKPLDYLHSYVEDGLPEYIKLKNFFEKENLQNLQGLKFEINDIKLELENAEPEVEPSREDTGVVKK